MNEKEYVVFWTFVGNYADNPIRLKAKNIKEAIEKSTWYDPKEKNDCGHQMRFIVFEEGKLVHNGTIDDVGKEPKVLNLVREE